MEWSEIASAEANVRSNGASGHQEGSNNKDVQLCRNLHMGIVLSKLHCNSISNDHFSIT